MLGKLIGVGALAGLLAAGATGPGMALTSSPSSTTTASLTVVGTPTFDDAATLSATYSSMKWVAEESITCTVAGIDVYLNVQTAPGTSQPWVSNWTLWSQTWEADGGAAANCTAQLYFYTWKGKSETGLVVLDSVSFTT